MKTMRRSGALTILCLAGILAACEREAEPEGYCVQVLDVETSIDDVDELRILLNEVRSNLYPQLDGVRIDLEPIVSETVYFNAAFDPANVEMPPRERRYIIGYNRRLFDAPPSYAAVVAVLAHELKHVLDYTEMDTEALIEFALWYMREDIAEYERATDEHALIVGCALALREFRVWLYDHIPPDAVEEKRRCYYTPEEIDAWMADG